MFLQVIAFTGPGARLAATHAAIGNLVVARASLSIPDTLFLFVVALVVFGPKRLPEIGKQIGKLVYEFRRASNDFKLQIEEELRVSEQQDRLKALEAQAAVAPPVDAAIDAPRRIEALAAPVPPDRSNSRGEARTEPNVEHEAILAGPDDKPNPRLMIHPPSSGAPVSALPPNHTALNAAVSPEAPAIPAASAPPMAQPVTVETPPGEQETQHG